MSRVFVSYRRKDTADIVGRLFDRLTGCFGRDRILLDVDALMAGESYREQIRRLIDNCRVVLAVVGSEWLTAATADGQRRLDDPDDQLRIELEAAFATGRRVIPILVHGASLPIAAELPPSLAPLAACAPVSVESGSGFPADFQVLLDRLHAAGVAPPDKAFPWQAVLLPLGGLLLLAGLVVCLGRPSTSAFTYILQQVAPGTPLAELRQFADDDPQRALPADGRAFDREGATLCGLGLLPLALGPMLLVWGKRRCCLQKERLASDRFYAQGSGRLPTPKSGKSLASLALGLASLACGPLTAVPALVLGGLAWREILQHPSWIRGRSLIVFGALASVAGLALFGLWQLPLLDLRRWIQGMERAEASRLAGDLSAADAALSAALELATGYPEASRVALLRRAAVRQQQGRDDEALADAELAARAEDASAATTGLPERLAIVREAQRRAHGLRAAIFEAQGRAAEAARERDAASAEPWRLFRPEPADAPPPAPPAAAPIVDPSTSTVKPPHGAAGRTCRATATPSRGPQRRRRAAPPAASDSSRHAAGRPTVGRPQAAG